MAEIVRPAQDGRIGTVNTTGTSNPAGCKALFVGGVYSNSSWADPINSNGIRWSDGRAGYTSINTILPPNSASCLGYTDGDGYSTAGSRHTGGAQVLMGDGSVRFISENINTGDLSQAPPTYNAGTPSPFGVWGGLGSKSGGEVIGEF